MTEFVFVAVAVIFCPFPLSFQSCPVSVDVVLTMHKFERVTVRVTACTFFVDLSMHNHASFLVSVNVRFRVRDHVSVRCRARIHGHVRAHCRFCRAGGHASSRDPELSTGHFSWTRPDPAKR